MLKFTLAEYVYWSRSRRLSLVDLQHYKTCFLRLVYVLFWRRKGTNTGCNWYIVNIMFLRMITPISFLLGYPQHRQFVKCFIESSVWRKQQQQQTPHDVFDAFDRSCLVCCQPKILADCGQDLCWQSCYSKQGEVCTIYMSWNQILFLATCG